ncbi:MAG TPA: tetratricopeptide repeat protein [Anaerolineales bacterium]|nr:tetratricopeptide repeat protein [Anaerolineales bacterium]
MALAFHLLGSPQFALDNLPISVNRRSIVALLAYLAVNDSGQARQKYTRESLSALLWPDYDQVKAFTNLRHALWEIQKAFGPGWLIANRETIGLRADANVWVDVHRFESLLSESQSQGDVSLRVPLLNESVKLYRHHFLTGFNLKNSPTFDAWSMTKADELHHKLTQVLTLLTEDYCLLEDAESALQYARRLVTLDPLNESAHRQLMQVYSQVGQHNAALKQYQTFEQTLRKELGLDPQPETRALYKQIRKGDIKQFRVETKGEKIAPQNNLPQQLATFIGREQQQTEILSLMDRNRLVTLTGSGGVGKTRLSLQVAAKLINHYPDGVWFIELTSLTNSDLIPQTILSTLRFGEQAGKTPLQILEEQLSNKKLLLILDNCEHLIESSARVAHRLLMSASEIKILATSREALGVSGELSWLVPSLSFPDLKSQITFEQLTQYESIRLFIERALLVQPHFKVDQASVPAIAQICSRLDGIPLAIELAAARVNALGVKQIAKRLDDRFRLLTRGNRTALERHQTLQAAIDWSYNLLDANEKKLLARLSVFMGGWTLEAAEQVCVRKRGEFDVLDVLSNLIDKSLVIMDSSTGEARYHFLETTRQYAREKLFESKQDGISQNQHLAYFVDLAEKGHSEITGPHQAEVLDLLDGELDNFRAALDWCLFSKSTEPALKILGALGWAWDMRGYYNEMRRWFEKICLLGDLASYPKAYAQALNHIGHFISDFDRKPEARPLLEESLTIWLKLGPEGERGLADVLCFLGMDAEFNNSGDLDEAESFYKRSLELSQRCNNQRMHAGSLMFMGTIESVRGDFASALNFYEQSLELAQDSGDLLVISLASGNMGSLFADRGLYEKARPLIEQEIKISEKLQFRHGLTEAWINLGDLYRREGHYVQAEQLFEKSMSASRDLGRNASVRINLYLLSMLSLHQNDYSSASVRFREYFDFAQGTEEKICLCRFFAGVAAVAGGTKQPKRCAKLFGAAQVMIESISDFQMEPFDRAEFDRHIQFARDQLGEAAFDTLSSEGRTMTTEQAVEFAKETKGGGP